MVGRFIRARLSQVSASSTLLMMALSAFLFTRVLAEPLPPRQHVNNQATRPYQEPPQPTSPPIGDGSIPSPAIPGDEGAPARPPSRKADPTHGNIFSPHPAPPGRQPTIYVPNAGRHPTWVGDSQGVLETRTWGPASGAKRKTPPKSNPPPAAVTRNDPKPYPWVGGWGPGRPWPSNPVLPPGKQGQRTKKVFVDAPINGLDLEAKPRPSHPNYPGWKEQELMMPMPTVRKFSRLLVIVGVVFACVLMAFAALSMVVGHAGAGQRVIATIGGLMLLLTGYTIYKIIMVNAFRLDQPEYFDGVEEAKRPQITAAPSPRAPAASVRDPDGEVNSGPLPAASLPATPTGGRAQPQRSGIPVKPLGASVNR